MEDPDHLIHALTNLIISPLVGKRVVLEKKAGSMWRDIHVIIVYDL